MNTYDKTPAESKPSWRDVLPVHPAADHLPLLPHDELVALADDIKQHGLQVPIVLWGEFTGEGASTRIVCQVLDGRNRLDAMMLAGMIETAPNQEQFFAQEGIRGCVRFVSSDPIWKDVDKCDDPCSLVKSTNVHRRHLTADQKREAIANILKARPDLSDRRIGDMVKADHKTVGTVRSEAEARGEIPHVETRKDSKGRKQPAKKVNPTKAVCAATPAAALAEQQIDNVCANADFSLPPGMPPISSTNEPVDADDLGQALNMLLNRPEPMPSFIHAALVAHANNLITRGAPDDWIACAKQVLTALASGRTGVLPFQ
jgi:hypothetical protein